MARTCAAMGASEQVLGTHSVANVRGVFFYAQQLHTCSAQGAPFIDHAMRHARVSEMGSKPR